MASTIRIKRSGVAGNPSTLGAGELAYSAADSSAVQGGDRLYIGFGTETNGNASNHIVIGGEYFTSKLDHALGTLTTDSAVLVDSNKKINEFYVDNLGFDGNTITSTDSNGDINLSPDGAGRTVAGNLYVDDGATVRSIQEYIEDISGGQIEGTPSAVSVSYDDPTGTTTIDLVETGVVPQTYGSESKIPQIAIDASGRITSASEKDVATSLSISGDNGTSGQVDLLDNTINFTGSGPLTVEVSDPGTTTETVTVSIEDASATQKGVASFDSTNFLVSGDAEVSAKSITLGSSTLDLGSTTSSIDGLNQIDVDNIRINGNTISATSTDGDVVISPDGSGVVDADDSRIVNVNAPSNSKDAANKQYVDNVAQGLQALPSADVATTQELVGVYDSGAGTISSSSPGAFPNIDGVEVSVGDNILVKDQSNLHENGSYVLVTKGDSTTNWVIQRCEFCNETEEVLGAFEFVVGGSQYLNTGWVATTPSDFVLGSTDATSDTNGFSTRGDIVWVQFSGAGTFTAGSNLSLDGTEFNLNENVSITSLVASIDLEITSTDNITFNGDGSVDSAPFLVAGGGVVEKDFVVGGNAAIASTAESTSISTGALVVEGGVGIVKDVFVGQNITGSGAETSALDGFEIDGGTY
jgi:hypothetical protein